MTHCCLGQHTSLAAIQQQLNPNATLYDFLDDVYSVSSLTTGQRCSRHNQAPAVHRIPFGTPEQIHHSLQQVIYLLPTLDDLQASWLFLLANYSLRNLPLPIATPYTGLARSQTLSELLQTRGLPAPALALQVAWPRLGILHFVLSLLRILGRHNAHLARATTPTQRNLTAWPHTPRSSSTFRASYPPCSKPTPATRLGSVRFVRAPATTPRPSAAYQ